MPAQAIEQLAALVQPFADLYASSKPLIIATTTLHLGGLLTGGGLAIATDRTILRVARTDGVMQRRVVGDVALTHKYVIAALAAIVISGLLFLAADVKTFLVSPVYWAKMSVVAGLLLNGVRLRRVEKKLNATAATTRDDVPAPTALWNNFRAGALTSVIAWFSILLLGVVLANN